MNIVAWDIKGEYIEVINATCETCNCFVAFHSEDTRRSHGYIGSCCAHPPQAVNIEDRFDRTFDFPSMFKGQCCAEWQKIIG